MVADLTIHVDTKAVEAALTRLSNHDIKDALVQSLNTIAKGARMAVQDRMAEVFDNPKSFTLNGFYNKPAKPNDLTAWVATRDNAPGGKPAIRYLGPQIRGGQRDMKKFEQRLRFLSEGQYVVPGSGLNLGPGDDLPRSLIMQILSRLNLAADPKLNMSDKTRRRLAKQNKIARGGTSEYFVGRERGRGRPTGIYKLVGPGKVIQVLKFVPKAPTYSVRLPVEQIVEAKIAAYAPAVLRRTVQRALRKNLP